MKKLGFVYRGVLAGFINVLFFHLTFIIALNCNAMTGPAFVFLILPALLLFIFYFVIKYMLLQNKMWKFFVSIFIFLIANIILLFVTKHILDFEMIFFEPPKENFLYYWTVGCFFELIAFAIPALTIFMVNKNTY